MHERYNPPESKWRRVCTLSKSSSQGDIVVYTVSHTSDSYRVTHRDPDGSSTLSSRSDSLSLRNPTLLQLTGNKHGCLCSGGEDVSSKPICDHVLLTRKRHYVCVPRLFSLTMIVSDTAVHALLHETEGTWETPGECSPCGNHQHLDNITGWT